MQYSESMTYRRLGKTELLVSEIGFGAEWIFGKDEAFACELVVFSVNPAFDMLPANDNTRLMFAPDTYDDSLW